MARGTVFGMAMILIVLSVPCWAQSNADLAQENAELRQRVGNLEKQVQGLAGSAATEADQQKTSDAGKIPLWSSLDIQFYGYLKADASYDTAQTNPGNFAVWVNDEAANANDDEFNLTANETRLGFKINGPKGDHIETSGQVEFDFYGSGGEENKAKIQLRHAFMQILWPESRFSILAGQTWDVMSPLNPSTLNYTVLWDVGNIGYRRPQIRITKDFAICQDTTVKLQAAAARLIGRNSAMPGFESGADAGFPALQARAGITFPWFGPKPTTLGLSGHWGQEEYDIAPNGANENFDSWSLNLDWLQPINAWMTLKAEMFTGENLGTYFGGIGQGVNIAGLNEIASQGGWCAVSLGPWDQWRFNVGMGIDDVDSGDVNTGDRTFNRSIFGNVIYALNKNLDVGFELSQWRTDYLGGRDADSVRAQTSFKYKF